MVTFFWVCFGVGVGYTVIAFLLGEAFHIGGFGGGTDGGIDGIDGGDFGGVSPLKPAVIAAFVTVFGAAGLLLRNFEIYLVLPLAATVGAAAAFLIYRFVIVPLSKAQNTSAAERQSLIGLKAKVTEKIFQGGYGQINYTVNGNTYTSPAKAEDGGAIERYSTVEIIYIKEGTYYVKGGI